MPIYAYRCNNCERQFDARQRFNDDPLTDCIYCDGNVRRVITPVGVVFKGAGFYVTDNRNGKANGSGRTPDQDKNEPADTTEKKSSSESETKPTAASSTDSTATSPANPS